MLAAACGGAAGLAPDLLAVLFRAGTPDSARRAAAKHLRATFAGPAVSVRPDAYYLRIPGGSADPRIAEQVIRLPVVQEVGPVPCPAP